MSPLVCDCHPLGDADALHGNQDSPAPRAGTESEGGTAPPFEAGSVKSDRTPSDAGDVLAPYRLKHDEHCVYGCREHHLDERRLSEELRRLGERR